MTENKAQQFLQFLKSLPETRAITFRGYVDATITEGRPIVTPTLGATSHSVAIATNNLEKPEVAIFCRHEWARSDTDLWKELQTIIGSS